jgi:HD-like signal output (HDOD) protein
MSFDQTQKRERTELIMKRVTNLSPAPRILTEVLDLLKDINTSPQTLAKAISKDQSLVVKILTISNSPFYGLSRRVASIEYAIMILGFNEIRNIVTALSLMESLKNKSDQYLNQKDFWIHSYITATISKKIADDMGMRLSGDAFIGGLLHDLGISVIHRYLHSDFVSICESVKTGMKYYDAEVNAIGMDHQEVGYLLLKNWNFPEQFCDLVRCHHKPHLSSSTKAIGSIVHFADYITQRLKLGFFSWDNDMELDHEVAATFQFKNQEGVDKFIELYHQPLEQQLESVRNLA